MKIFEGIVTSIGMNKTVVVEVSRKTPHPLYKKLIKRSKKLKADNTGFEELKIGNRVKIIETRPISKNKYFRVSQILAGFAAPVKKEETVKVEEDLEKPEPKIVKKRTTVSKVKKGESK